MKRAVLLIAAGLLALACNEDKAAKPDEKPAAATTSTATAAATGETAATDDAEDIPTEADFEDEAETQITSANMESELDALEKEIGE
ncbi:MAG: hypothetical protein AB7K71_38515 [Polyangiaceae bacterium]